MQLIFPGLRDTSVWNTLKVEVEMHFLLMVLGLWGTVQAQDNAPQVTAPVGTNEWRDQRGALAVYSCRRHFMHALDQVIDAQGAALAGWPLTHFRRAAGNENGPQCETRNSSNLAGYLGRVRERDDLVRVKINELSQELAICLLEQITAVERYNR